MSVVIDYFTHLRKAWTILRRYKQWKHGVICLIDETYIFPWQWRQAWRTRRYTHDKGDQIWCYQSTGWWTSYPLMETLHFAKNRMNCVPLQGQPYVILYPYLTLRNTYINVIVSLHIYLPLRWTCRSSKSIWPWDTRVGSESLSDVETYV